VEENLKIEVLVILVEVEVLGMKKVIEKHLKKRLLARPNIYNRFNLFFHLGHLSSLPASFFSHKLLPYLKIQQLMTSQEDIALPVLMDDTSRPTPVNFHKSIHPITTHHLPMETLPLLREKRIYLPHRMPWELLLLATISL
jgi:hypothetical protein